MADPNAFPHAPLLGDQSGLYATLERLRRSVEALDEEDDAEDAPGPSIDPPGWRDPPRERR